MAAIPTVRLQRADGLTIKVNASNYADNIEGWLSKGFKLVGEEARLVEPAVIVTQDPEVDLEAMTKAELVSFAADSLDLILDEAMKKADMIEAVRSSFAKASEDRSSFAKASKD